MKVVYPGSFDPPTVGHASIVSRAAGLFDEVVILVLGNPNKHPRADIQTRKALWAECIKSFPNVRVEAGEGLLLDAVRRLHADAILRGLRSEADFSAERPVADAFFAQYGVETVYLTCAPEWTYVSSSMVREILDAGGDVRSMLPEAIADRIEQVYRAVNA